MKTLHCCITALLIAGPRAWAQSPTPAPGIESALSSMREHMLENEENFHNRKYATTESVARATDDANLLRLMMQATAKTPEEKRLKSQAGKLLSAIERQRRALYASMMERVFLEQGMDVTVTAEGEAKEILRVKSVLMTRPLVYHLHNGDSLEPAAAAIRFQKVIYDNGYNATWPSDLKRAKKIVEKAARTE